MAVGDRRSPLSLGGDWEERGKGSSTFVLDKPPQESTGVRRSCSSRSADAADTWSEPSDVVRVCPVRVAVALDEVWLFDVSDLDLEDVKAVFFTHHGRHASLLLALLADMGASLVVIANGLRLLRRPAHSTRANSRQNTSTTVHGK